MLKSARTPGARRDLRLAQRRQRILDAAARFFREVGDEHVTLGALDSAARWFSRLPAKNPEDVAQKLFSIWADGPHAAVVYPKQSNRRANEAGRPTC